MVQLQGLFQFPGRQLEGFLRSLFSEFGIELEVPEHTTLCRRLKTLGRKVVVRHSCQGCHIIFDATGLKVYGEGEWKVRQHGKEKRRLWRKLHICLDEATQEILSCVAYWL
jgi:hypothetical protein